MLPRGDLQIPYRIEHRHTDGTSHAMERVHRDVAEHDPERSWVVTQEFQCVSCDETVTLIPDEET